MPGTLVTALSTTCLATSQPIAFALVEYDSLFETSSATSVRHRAGVCAIRHLRTIFVAAR
eukprot:1048488-Prymnesium_polylepis.1